MCSSYPPVLLASHRSDDVSCHFTEWEQAKAKFEEQKQLAATNLKPPPPKVDGASAATSERCIEAKPKCGQARSTEGARAAKHTRKLVRNYFAEGPAECLFATFE